jgi:hypothetical protein
VAAAAAAGGASSTTSSTSSGSGGSSAASNGSVVGGPGGLGPLVSLPHLSLEENILLARVLGHVSVQGEGDAGVWEGGTRGGGGGGPRGQLQL